MKPERLPIPNTRVVNMFEIFQPITNAFLHEPKEVYDAEAHAKFVRVRKAAYEANYHLEAQTRLFS